jgi:lysophospholipase L1-like esterase
MLKHALACGLLLVCDIAIGAPKLNLLVLGDSISQGYNAVELGAAPEYSWATGNKIHSYQLRLEQIGYEVTSKNAAIPGAPSSWLGLELYLSRALAPDIALIEIGANDMCRPKNNQDTVWNINWAVARLLEKNLQVQIVIAGIPRLSAVYDSKKGAPNCLEHWKVSACPAFLSPDLSEADRNANQLKIDAANNGLKELASHYPANVRYVKEIGETPIQPEDISDVDCFHPSPTGQQRLSDAAFAVPN